MIRDLGIQVCGGKNTRKEWKWWELWKYPTQRKIQWKVAVYWGIGCYTTAMLTPHAAAAVEGTRRTIHIHLLLEQGLWNLNLSKAAHLSTVKISTAAAANPFLWLRLCRESPWQPAYSKWYKYDVYFFWCVLVRWLPNYRAPRKHCCSQRPCIVSRSVAGKNMFWPIKVNFIHCECLILYPWLSL